jgi:PKD repeat protein
MVNRINILSGVLLVLLLQGCKKKEEPEIESGTPVFNINGAIDNTSKEYIGGKKDYFMYTDYRLPNGELYEFIGDMKQTCTDCKESLRVIIRNYQAGSGTVDPGQAFHTGEYFYTPPKGTQFNKSLRVSFDATPSGNGTVSHLWNFGDGTTSTAANPVKIFPTNSPYTVTYTVSYSNGCSSSVAIPVKLKTYGPPPSEINFSYSVDTFSSDNFTFFASASDSSASSNLYLWDFGDAGNASGTIVNHQYLIPGVYTVTLTYIKNNTDTIITRKNLSALHATACIANFNYSLQPISDPFMYSGITVEWTDASGVTYSSDKALQENSDFFINTSAPYIDNDRGQKTRALDVIFNCSASDGTKVIDLKNIKGHIAVAHP